MCKTCDQKWIYDEVVIQPDGTKYKMPMKLCQSCTAEIDALRDQGTFVKTIHKGLWGFSIYKKSNDYLVQVNAQSHLEGKFLDIAHCEEAINSWVCRSWKFAGIVE